MTYKWILFCMKSIINNPNFQGYNSVEHDENQREIRPLNMLKRRYNACKQFASTFAQKWQQCVTDLQSIFQHERYRTDYMFLVLALFKIVWCLYSLSLYYTLTFPGIKAQRKKTIAKIPNLQIVYLEFKT